jgi:hypothetical protein
MKISEINFAWKGNSHYVDLVVARARIKQIQSFFTYNLDINQTVTKLM